MFGEIGGRMGTRADEMDEAQERECEEEDEGANGLDPESQPKVAEM